MIIKKILKEDYKIKFGTRLYADDDVLDKVRALADIDEKEDIANIKSILDCTANLLLSGLQKDEKHTQYHYEIGNMEDKKEKRNLIFNLLDDFVEDGGNIMELFTELNQELMNLGFLGVGEEEQTEEQTESRPKKTKN